MAYVYKRADGLWHWRVNRTIDGKRKPINSKIGVKLKSVAKHDAEAVEQKLKRGEFIETKSSDVSFPVFYENWAKTFYIGKKTAAGDKHFYSALTVAKKYFSDKRIQDITSADYQKMLDDYGADHAKPTVRNIHIYLKRCFVEYFEDGIIQSNPTKRATVVGNTKLSKTEEEKYLNFKDFEKLMQLCRQRARIEAPSTAELLLIGMTGLRFEEATALTWSNFDFEKNTLTIKHAWDFKKHDFGPTKNASSVRTIKVDSSTMSFMRIWQRWCNELKLKRPGYNPKGLVFVKINGYPISNKAINKQLSRLCLAAGIETKEETESFRRFTCHGLRHTHASVLIYRGCDVSYISKRLGHGSINITYQVYSHVIKELAARSDAEIESLMGKVLKEKAQ